MVIELYYLCIQSVFFIHHTHRIITPPASYIDSAKVAIFNFYTF